MKGDINPGIPDGMGTLGFSFEKLKKTLNLTLKRHTSPPDSVSKGREFTTYHSTPGTGNNALADHFFKFNLSNAPKSKTLVFPQVSLLFLLGALLTVLFLLSFKWSAHPVANNVPTDGKQAFLILEPAEQYHKNPTQNTEITAVQKGKMAKLNKSTTAPVFQGFSIMAKAPAGHFIDGPATEGSGFPMRSQSKHSKAVPIAPKVLAGAPSLPENILLHGSLEPIRRKAAAQNKLIIVAFGAKWCMPCRMMEQGTFKNTDLLAYIEANYLMQKIDVDDFEGFNIKQHYKVEVLPTFIFFDTGGNILARYEQSFSAVRLLNLLKRHRKVSSSRPVAQESKRMLEPVSSLSGEKTRGTAISGIKIATVQLLKRPDGKPLKKLKKNGKNWNFTKVRFQLTDLQLKHLNGSPLLLKIVEGGSPKTLAQLDIPHYSRNNFIQIPHPGRKVLAENYVIQLFYRQKGEGVLISLLPKSKPIVTNYGPLE